MKNYVGLLVLMFAFACSRNADDNAGSAASSDTEAGQLERNSDENISPELEDSASRLNVDTVSSTGDIQERKR